MGSLRDLAKGSNPYHEGRKISKFHTPVTVYLCLGFPGWRGRSDLHCDECPRYFECAEEERRIIEKNPHIRRFADWHSEGGSCFGRYLKGTEDRDLNRKCKMCQDQDECRLLAEERYKMDLSGL
jgi:hypothetical protein